MLQEKIRLNIYLSFVVVFIIASSYIEASEKLHQQILFVRNGDVWKINVDKKEELLLIKKAKIPTCSRNGKQIAFVREGNIWLYDLVSQKSRKVTSFTSDNADIQSLEWFPKEDKIAFSVIDEYELKYSGKIRKVVWPEDSYEEKEVKLQIRNIWIAATNGSNLEKWIGMVPGSGTIGTQISDVNSPKWSPDGRVIIFSRNGDIWLAEVTNDELSTMDKKEKRIAAVAYLENHYSASSNSLFADHFSWSPDGKFVVFEIHRDHGSGFGEIWRMNSKGGEIKKLFSPNEESFPQLSPDGKYIAFVQNFALWIMDVDKAFPRKIADNIDWNQVTWCCPL